MKKHNLVILALLCLAGSFTITYYSDTLLSAIKNIGADRGKTEEDLLSIAEGGDAVNNKKGKKSADVDLTALNRTMAYAKIHNMMTKPDNYLGKTVRADGNYDFWCPEEQEELSNLCFHFVVIADAAACCQTGLEFRLSDGKPGNYPEQHAKIQVTGVFSSYEMEGRKYYHLATDDIVVVK